ncbi:MAG: hypothetical protein ACI87W_002615 [Halieaceae bacterium]|jgi:hypothetical protein
MASSFLPDTQLLFSAELAAAVGLREAIMLQQLNGLYLHQPASRREDLNWLHVSRAYLLQLLPFWDDSTVTKICDSLEELGLLRIDRPNAAPNSLLFAISAGSKASIGPPAAGATAATPPAAKVPVAVRTETGLPSAPGMNPSARPARAEGQPLSPSFQPSEDMLELLERFHGVPRNFALQQLEDFSLYWRERGNAAHAWQNKFKQHVQFQWAKHQQDKAPGVDHGGQRGTGAARRTRDSSLEHDLTDTSWAE